MVNEPEGLTEVLSQLAEILGSKANYLSAETLL